MKNFFLRQIFVPEWLYFIAPVLSLVLAIAGFNYINNTTMAVVIPIFSLGYTAFVFALRWRT